MAIGDGLRRGTVVLPLYTETPVSIFFFLPLICLRLLFLVFLVLSLWSLFLFLSSFVLCFKTNHPFFFSTLLSKISTTPSLFFTSPKSPLCFLKSLFSKPSISRPRFSKTNPRLLFCPPVLWFSPCIYRRQGERVAPPRPAQAQGKVVWAWLAILFRYGGKEKEVWIVSGFGQVGTERVREKSVFFIKKKSFSSPAAHLGEEEQVI